MHEGALIIVKLNNRYFRKNYGGKIAAPSWLEIYKFRFFNLRFLFLDSFFFYEAIRLLVLFDVIRV